MGDGKGGEKQEEEYERRKKVERKQKSKGLAVTHTLSRTVHAHVIN